MGHHTGTVPDTYPDRPPTYHIMKSLFTLVFALFAVSFATAQDATPTPDRIAAAYIENIGGAEAWKAITTTRQTGKMSMQGMEFPVTLTAAEGNKMRIDVNVQGQKIIQATNGEMAWQVMPFQGINEPTAMSDDEAADMKDQEFLNEFIDYEERGFILTAVEGREIEGTATLGVRVTHKERDTDRTYYFDPEYMIPVAMTSVSKSGPMKGREMMTLLSDYAEHDGLIVPMFMEVKLDGQPLQKITLSEMENNVELEEDFFSLPKKEAAPKE